MTDWVTDPTDPEAMLDYFYGNDPYADINAPTFNESMLANLIGITPTIDLEGDFISPSTQSSIWNRWRTSLFDPMFAGMGGGQAFAPGTFDSTISYEMIDSPALTALNMYRRNPQGSIEGMVLEELENGGTPATAFSYLRSLATQDNELGDLVRGQLLPATDGSGMIIEGEYNWDNLLDRVNQVQIMMTEAPQAGPQGAVFDQQGNMISQGGENVVMQDAEGNPIMVRQVTTPSPLAEKYAELGLTPPGVPYTPMDFTQPGWEADMANYQNVLQPAAAEALQRFLDTPMPGPMGAAQLAGPAIDQPAPPTETAGGGGWNWGNPFDDPRFTVPRPGAPGAANASIQAVVEGLPWVGNQALNQQLGPAGANIISQIGSGDSVATDLAIANAATPGGLPGLGWNVVREGLDWLNPWSGGGDEESAPEPTAREGSGWAGESVYYPQSALMQAMLGLKNTEIARKLTGYPSERPASDEAPPPGATVPAAPPEPAPPPSGDALVDWMRDLVANGSTREGAINYAVSNGVDAEAAGRAYDQAVPGAREAPPSASEIPQQTSSASDYLMQLLAGQGQTPLSPTGPLVFNEDTRLWENAPPQPPLPEPRLERTQLGPWQPPSDNWLGINWGGREGEEPEPFPPTGGAADQFMRNLIALGQGQFPTTATPTGPDIDETEPGHYIIQLPPGTPPGPPQPEPLTGPEDQVGPGHYVIQLPGGGQQVVQDRRGVTRPVRHPEEPYGGADYEAMLNYMLSQSRTQSNAAAAPQFVPPPSEQIMANEREERLNREPTGVETRGGDRYRSVLLTGQSQAGARRNRLREWRNLQNMAAGEFRRLNEDYGAALAQAGLLQQQGVTPYDQQIMARRMAIMASGMPTGNYFPGT